MIMSRSLPKAKLRGNDFRLSTDENLREQILSDEEDFPVVLYTQNFCHDARDEVPFHWHDDLQLTWVAEGTLSFHVNDDSFLLDQNQLVLVNRRQFHSSKTIDRDVRTLCINFRPEVLHPLILDHFVLPWAEQNGFTHDVYPVTGAQSEQLRSFLCDTDRPLLAFSVMNFLASFFEEILRTSEEGRGSRTDAEELALFQKALNYIHNHFSEPLTVRQISAMAATNKNRLTDLFNKYTGRPPIAYLNDYRLSCARRMILDSDRPISDISADAGFNQISHFIALFRKAYGLSPLRYRKRFASPAARSEKRKAACEKEIPGGDSERRFLQGILRESSG